MKRFLLLIGLSAAMPALLQAESTVKKVEKDVEHAAEATDAAVKKAAKKADTTLKKDTEKADDAVKKAAKKTEGAVEGGARKTGDAVKGAADKTAKGIKKISDDITGSETYKKIEKELGKPFTPEQQQKYAAALKAAQAKVREAKDAFAKEVSDITGIGKRKTSKIVGDSEM